MSVLDLWLQEAKNNVHQKAESLQGLLEVSADVDHKMKLFTQLIQRYPKFTEKTRKMESLTLKIEEELAEKRKEVGNKFRRDKQKQNMEEELLVLQKELDHLVDLRKKKESLLLEKMHSKTK